MDLEYINMKISFFNIKGNIIKDKNLEKENC
jgi:hypothetical protein